MSQREPRFRSSKMWPTNVAHVQSLPLNFDSDAMSLMTESRQRPARLVTVHY